MLISLYLRHFRNYEEAQLEFSPSLNLICGPNAKGKTSLLEAIHYLMTGRSFRASNYQDLIQEGFSSFYLEAAFTKHGIEQRLHLAQDQERKIVYNSTVLPNLSALLGLIQGVVITPDDVNLIKGAPLLRRQFLDIQIAQIDPLYVYHLNRYARAMRQRNYLLKTKQLATIEAWEQEMARSAAYLIYQRHKAIQDLQPKAQHYYQALTGESSLLTLYYAANVMPAPQMDLIQKDHLKLLHKNREREALVGYTLSGPHKDDLLIAIGGRDSRLFASEGQQRSCVNALHFAEWQRLKEMSGEQPLLMIDDVGMSLDANRKKRLLDQLKGVNQVFLTTTEPSLLDAFSGDKRVFTLPFYTSLR